MYKKPIHIIFPGLCLKNCITAYALISQKFFFHNALLIFNLVLKCIIFYIGSIGHSFMQWQNQPPAHHPCKYNEFDQLNGFWLISNSQFFLIFYLSSKSIDTCVVSEMFFPTWTVSGRWVNGFWKMRGIRWAIGKITSLWQISRFYLFVFKRFVHICALLFIKKSR